MAEMNLPLITKLSTNVSDAVAPSARPADIRKEVTAFFRRCCLADVHCSSHCQAKTHLHQRDISAFTNWDHFVPAPVNASLFPIYHQPPGASGSRTITVAPPAPQNQVLTLRLPVLRLVSEPSSNAVPSPSSAKSELSVPGAVGDSRPGDRLPGKKILLNQIKTLAKELEQVADQLSKANEHTREGTVQIAQLEAKKKDTEGKINDIKCTYRKLYGENLLRQYMHWRTAVHQAMCKEDSTSPQAFDELQSRISGHTEEMKHFLIRSLYNQCNSLLRQLHLARTRKESNDRATFVRDMINSNNPVMPNHLRGGDDQHLYGYFDHLRQHLENLECILKMPDLSAADQQQTRLNIIITTAKVERIVESFSIISRYTRLHEDSSHLYPHQLAEMQQTIRKGKRLSSTSPSPRDQERRGLVAKLKQEHPEVTIDDDAILDMEEQDFQLVMALLGQKPLTEDQRKTLQRNGWQQTERNNLVVNRGPEKVRIQINEDRYQLIDSTSGDIIGTLTPDRWERIKQRLENEGRSLSQVTRQMIIEDFIKFPISSYQYRWSHNVCED